MNKSIKIMSMIVLSLSVGVVSVGCNGSDKDVDRNSQMQDIIAEETNEHSKDTSETERIAELKDSVDYLTSLSEFKHSMEESSTKLSFIFHNDNFTDEQKLEELKKEKDSIVLACDNIQAINTPQKYDNTKSNLTSAIGKFREFAKTIEESKEFNVDTLRSNIKFLSGLEETYKTLNSISASGDEYDSVEIDSKN